MILDINLSIEHMDEIRRIFPKIETLFELRYAVDVDSAKVEDFKAILEAMLDPSEVFKSINDNEQSCLN